MTNAIDQYGREVLSEPIPTGGTRYFTADRSVCVGLNPASPTKALEIFNATPPAGMVVAESNSDPERIDEILEAMESLTPAQATKLAKILAKVK